MDWELDTSAPQDVRFVCVKFWTGKVADVDVEQYLRRYCEILQPVFKPLDQFGLWYGIRRYKVKLCHNSDGNLYQIPNSILLGPYSGKISYPGQVQRCYICGSQDHQVKDCETLKYWKCRELGHRVTVSSVTVHSIISPRDKNSRRSQGSQHCSYRGGEWREKDTAGEDIVRGAADDPRQTEEDERHQTFSRAQKRPERPHIPPHTNNWTDISIDHNLSVGPVRNPLSQLQKSLTETLVETLNGNIRESVSTELKRIQQFAVDVTLDADTAHPKLILSDDGKQFNYEVQVREKTAWTLGVALESINRRGKIKLKPQNGIWAVALRYENEYKAHADPSVLLSLREELQKVGMFVEYEEGLVSFYDVESRSHIYSFTGQSFTEKLYPCFDPCGNEGGVKGQRRKWLNLHHNNQEKIEGAALRNQFTFLLTPVVSFLKITEQYHCPFCKEKFTKRPELKVKTTFGEVVDHFKKKSALDKPENLEDYICQKHRRPLELFCRDDQMSVCMVCTLTDHKKHNTVPVEEGIGEMKSQLEKTQSEVQQMIKDRLKKIKDIKHSVEISKKNMEKEIADSIEVTAALICSIERSQAELLEMMEENQKAAERQAEDLIKELEQEITKLKTRHSELEQLSHTEDHLHLLQIYPSVCRPPHTSNNRTDISTDSIIDLSVDIVWNVLSQLQKKLNKMIIESELMMIQQYAVDVTLDADTAHPKLILSDDGKQVRDGGTKQHLPDNPKRFDRSLCVLGKEGFSSGRFYYEVQVSEKTEWDLGVARESINRKYKKVTLTPKNGFWTMKLRNGYAYKACVDSPVLLFLRKWPQKVGVFVDYEEGRVSFYDVESRSHIYSFTGQSFTEKLYPYFSPRKNDGGVLLLNRPAKLPRERHRHHLTTVQTFLRESETEKLWKFISNNGLLLHSVK
ncbi:hypothetical protein MHYP_G00012890 [Metynnis hypsauchen]